MQEGRISVSIKSGQDQFTEHQILSILQEADAGLKVQDVCRNHGISQAAYYQWKAKFGGMQASDIKRLRELEAEVSQYKRMYAELAHENYALREVITKKL
jgi:putative transposase